MIELLLVISLIYNVWLAIKLNKAKKQVITEMSNTQQVLQMQHELHDALSKLESKPIKAYVVNDDIKPNTNE